MHAEVDARIARGGFGEFEEPGAGHHDGAGAADAELHQLEESGVGAVAHADIVFMQHQPAFGFGRAHRAGLVLADASLRRGSSKVCS